MLLELVTTSWLDAQPAFLQFSASYPGSRHATRRAEFVDSLLKAGLVVLVDERGRAFVDVQNPLWQHLTKKAATRGFLPTLTRDDVPTASKSGASKRAIQKAKYRQRVRDNKAAAKRASLAAR